MFVTMQLRGPYFGPIRPTVWLMTGLPKNWEGSFTEAVSGSVLKKLPESAWWVLSWDCCALLKKARQYELLSSNDLRSASQFCALLKLSRIFTLTRAGVWRKILVWLKILIKNFSRENCDSEFLLKNVGISRISVN